MLTKTIISVRLELMNDTSSAFYVSRPVNPDKAPLRVPLTEWEIKERKTGEDLSDLSGFSVPSENEGISEFIEKHQDDFTGKSVSLSGKNDIAKDLQDDLDFLSTTHILSSKQIEKGIEKSQEVISSKKYTYFENEKAESVLLRKTDNDEDFANDFVVEESTAIRIIPFENNSQSSSFQVSESFKEESHIVTKKSIDIRKYNPIASKKGVSTEIPKEEDLRRQRKLKEVIGEERLAELETIIDPAPPMKEPKPNKEKRQSIKPKSPKFDPGETKAVQLRRKEVRQRIILIKEAERMKEAEEEERKMREMKAAKRVAPELRKLQRQVEKSTSDSKERRRVAEEETKKKNTVLAEMISRVENESSLLKREGANLYNQELLNRVKKSKKTQNC